MKNYKITANLKRDNHEYTVSGTYTRKSDALRGLKRYMKKYHRALSTLTISEMEDNTIISSQSLIDYSSTKILLNNRTNLKTYKFSY